MNTVFFDDTVHLAKKQTFRTLLHPTHESALQVAHDILSIRDDMLRPDVLIGSITMKELQNVFLAALLESSFGSSDSGRLSSSLLLSRPEELAYKPYIVRLVGHATKAAECLSITFESFLLHQRKLDVGVVGALISSQRFKVAFLEGTEITYQYGALSQGWQRASNLFDLCNVDLNELLTGVGLDYEMLAEIDFDGDLMLGDKDLLSRIHTLNLFENMRNSVIF